MKQLSCSRHTQQNLEHMQWEQEQIRMEGYLVMSRSAYGCLEKRTSAYGCLKSAPSPCQTLKPAECPASRAGTQVQLCVRCLHLHTVCAEGPTCMQPTKGGGMSGGHPYTSPQPNMWLASVLQASKSMHGECCWNASVSSIPMASAGLASKTGQSEGLGPKETQTVNKSTVRFTRNP
jgi:hypothetical protein